MPAIKQIPLFRNLPTILAIVTASVAIAWLVLSAKTDYERDIHLGERQTELLATGLQDTTERQFNEINGEISAIRLALERQRASPLPPPQSLNNDVLRGLDDDDDILRVVASVDGTVVLDVSPIAPAAAIGLSNIEWSPISTPFPFGSVNIGMPFAGPDGNGHVLPMRYDFTAPDGADAVQIVALTDASRVLASYESVDLAPGSAFAVFRSDGVLLTRWPDEARYVGRRFQGPVFGEHLRLSPSGTIRALIETDSNERILTYRTANGWPLVVVAGVPVRGLLLSWWASLPGKSLLLLFVFSAIFLLWVALTSSQSALRRSVEELTVSEGRYARLLANIPGGVYTRRLIAPNRFSYPFASPGFQAIFGLTREELATGAESLLQLIHPDDRQPLIDSMIASCEGDEVWTREFRLVKPNGQLTWVQSLARRYRGENGEILWDGITVNTTDLRQYQALLEQVQESADLGYWTWQPSSDVDPRDRRRRRTSYSKASAAILGVPWEQLQITDEEFTQRHVHPEDRERVAREYERFLESNAVSHDLEFRILWPNRATRWLRGTATKEIVAGSVVGVIGVLQDITEAKAHEAQLVQSQKMEAIGELTGGVAHDFNNMLTVIIGNLENLFGRIRNDPSMAELVQASLNAADRGATLTKRLLAFARRQPLSPQSTDLGALLADLSPLIKRSVGELIEVAIETDPDLPNALVDPHQLENALINLTNNARDAMPRGGKLSIHVSQTTLQASQASLPPDGDLDAIAGGEADQHFLRVTVTDTGVGMSHEVLERALEPFFTTKPVGQGTGLGLSMVYGLARQSKGHLRIYSEPGIGTTISMYLPQASEPAVAYTAVGDKLADFSGLRALLVDDDPPVRATTAAILRSLGFEVGEAAAGKEAMRILENGAAFDVLVTDVILAGGMLGTEVAERARALKPQIRVLFISGFASDLTANQQPLLSKPFRRAELAGQLAKLLRG